MTFTPNPNYYKELKSNVADELVSLITDVNAKWRKTWRPNPNDRYIPINAITKEEYKGMNIWLLWGESSSNVWCTMNGWRKLGYSVKGAKSKKIYFFKPNQKPIIEDGKVKTNDKGEEEYYTTWTFKHYSVFKAEDVHSVKDGSAYPIPAVDNSHLDHSITPIENCKKFFDNLNAKIIHDGIKCFYRPSTDEIGMPDIKQFDNAEEYYSVLAHEHIHWSGSDTRLKREKLNYAEEELVAELGAFLTCIHLGTQSTPKPNNLAYLKSWSNGDINKMKIFSALSDAHKGVNYLKEQQVKEVKKVA